MAMQSGNGIVDILIIAAGVGYTGTVLIKTGNLFGLIREFKLLGKRLLGFGDQTEGAEGKGDNAAQVSRVRSTITKETWGERLDRMNWRENHPDPLLADLIDFALSESWDLTDHLQEQLEFSGRSPGLLTYSGTPDLKGLKSTVETLSNSLDRSASDSIVLDGMDKPEQKRKPLSRSIIYMEEESQITKGKYAADISSIKEAHARIKSLVLKTPVLSSSSLNAISGRQLYFKCECFQKGGAFKFRGASNAVFSLDDEDASKGVITHSSGNHAAALALAAKLRGIPAYIVIPKNAPNCKVENVKRYGGQVIWSEATMRSREEVANKVWQETGATLIHPYNDGRILSGQGTISLELLEQVPQIDTLVVPISGGGLISGVALAAKSINPSIRILAAEPKGADDAAQSKAAGRIITLPVTNTIADGLRACLGDFTWPVVRDLVEDIITVEDSEIIKAMKLCFEILKIVVEPSGAIGLAAVLSETFQKSHAWKDCNHIGIVVSGGNVDMAVLWDSFNKCK